MYIHEITQQLTRLIHKNSKYQIDNLPNAQQAREATTSSIVIHQMRFSDLDGKGRWGTAIISSILFLNEINVLLVVANVFLLRENQGKHTHTDVLKIIL